MLLIRNDSEFGNLLQDLRKQKIIGIDTEFVRRNTYFAELCLLQISTPDNIFIVDPKLVTLNRFVDILSSSEIVKIFHACAQDVRIFHHMLKVKTANIFDTQEAVKFVGIKHQISYQEACQKILSEPIKKEQQFRDWNIRPQPENMLEYAAQDVKHLISLHDTLKATMEHKRIFINFCKFMESFSSDEFYSVKFHELWKKVQTKETSPYFLKKIQFLASFRETCAIELNMPRGRILSDYEINIIAQKLPENPLALSKLGIKLPLLSKSHITKLMDLCSGIRAGL